MKEENKKGIMKAAVRLFYKKGFSAATTAEIAAEAGVAEVTLFRHFKTKKDLLINAMEHFTDIFGQELVIKPLNEMLESKKTKSAKEIIRTLLRERIELIDKNWDILWIVITEMRHHPELKDKIMEKAGRKGVAIVKQILEYGVKNGELKEVTAEAAIRGFFGTIITTIAAHKVFPDLMRFEKTFDESIDEAIDILLYGIAVPV